MKALEMININYFMNKMKYLIIAILLFGCSAESLEVETATANEITIKDLGFTQHSKEGVMEEKIMCPDESIAISPGCACSYDFIMNQSIKNNGAYCKCGGNVEMTVSVVCASIKY